MHPTVTYLVATVRIAVLWLFLTHLQHATDSHVQKLSSYIEHQSLFLQKASLPGALLVLTYVYTATHNRLFLTHLQHATDSHVQICCYQPACVACISSLFLLDWSNLSCCIREIVKLHRTSVAVLAESITARSVTGSDLRVHCNTQPLLIYVPCMLLLKYHLQKTGVERHLPVRNDPNKDAYAEAAIKGNKTRNKNHLHRWRMSP
eukprot:g40416.t1